MDKSIIYIYIGFIIFMTIWFMFKSSHGFWNDTDGLTVVDLLAFGLGFSTIGIYMHFGSIDDNFSDILIAALLASAGQFVGVRWNKSSRSSKIDINQQNINNQNYDDINNKL